MKGSLFPFPRLVRRLALAGLVAGAVAACGLAPGVDIPSAERGNDTPTPSSPADGGGNLDVGSESGGRGSGGAPLGGAAGAGAQGFGGAAGAGLMESGNSREPTK